MRSPSRGTRSRRKGSTQAELGIAFVTPDEIKALKAEHLGIDEATDVLSFPIDGLDELPDGVPRALGDVVICPQVVGEEWRWPLVHGILHLLGFDHGDDDGAPRARDPRGGGMSPAPGRRPPSILESFNVAFEGIIHVLRTQRNMRIHFLIAVAVLIAALAVDVSKIELIVLLLSIAFVLIAEMINTAVEAAVDIASTSFDPMAKLAKDIAAGAVLIAAVNAVAVGYLVFSGQVADRSNAFLDRLSKTPAELTLVALVHRRRPRDLDEGALRARHAAARRLALGPRGGRVRRLDGDHAHARRLRAPLPRLLARVHHGAARRADAGRGRRPFHPRGRHRRYSRRHRGARHLPGVLGMTDEELLARADAIASRAYAPYSGFNVGCAVLTRDGTVVEGVNVENAAYPLGVCAERTTFSRAIVDGLRPGRLHRRGDHRVAVRRLPAVARRDAGRAGRLPQRRPGRPT